MANDPFGFLDPTTGLSVDVPEGEAEKLYLEGKIGLKKSSEVPVYDTKEEQVVRLPSDKLQEALELGRWRFPSPAEKAEDTARQQIRDEGFVKSAIGGTKRFATQAIDEFLLGAPETAADAYQGYRKFDKKTGELTDFGRRTVEAEERPISNALGWLTGVGGSLFYGGPALRAVEEGAAKVASKYVEKAVTNKLTQNALSGTVGLAAGGVAAGALPAGARVAGAALGDPDAVGQALVASGTELATFGLLNTGVGAIAKAGASGLGFMGSALKLASSPNASAEIQKMADTAALKQFGWNTSQFRSAAKNQYKIGGASSVLDLEDEAGGALLKTLERGDEKTLNAKVLEGLKKFITIDPKVPRFKAAEDAVAQLEKANEKILGIRKSIVERMDNTAAKGLVSEQDLLTPLKNYKQELLDFRGGKLADEAGVKELDSAISSIEDFFEARRAPANRGKSPSAILGADGQPLREAVPSSPVSITFKEADELRSLIGDITHNKVSVPAMGISKGPKNQIASDTYTLIKNSLINTVEKAEKEGLLAAGSAKKYLDSGKNISEIMLYKDIMQSAADVAGANAIVSPADLIIGAASSSVGGLPLAIATGTVSFIKRQYGNVISEKILRGAANTIDRFGARVDNALNASMGLVKSLESPAKLTSISVFDKYFNGSGNKEEQLRGFLGDLSKTQGDPEILNRSVEALAGPMLQTDPLIGTQMQATINTGVGYLLSVAPKPATPVSPLNPTPFTPTDSQLSRFKRQVDAVFNPESVLRDMAKGVATKEQFDALKIVYPKLFSAIQKRALEKLASAPKSLSYSARQKLSYLLEEPMGLNNGLQNVRMLQQNFASKGAPKPRANSKITESGRQQTDIGRVISE